MRAAYAALCAASLAGCALTGPDGGFGEVSQAVNTRTGVETKWVRSPEEADAVRERGARVVTADVSEFHKKGGGSVKCMIGDLGDITDPP